MTSGANEYFSDKELGPRSLILDDLPPNAWLGIAATFRRLAEQHYFAAEFPEQCQDGQGIAGTDMDALHGLLYAHVPALGGVPIDQQLPDTATAMDVVEFCWRHVQEPDVVNHHGFFHHDHYRFDQGAGRHRWRVEINQILDRNGVALRLEASGRVVRVGTAAAEAVLRSLVPKSGDSQLDAKIASTVEKYRDPSPDVRREALEALWDAFERVKTLIDPDDKKASAVALVEMMAVDSANRTALDDEFTALTKLGNRFQIRHHEADRHPVESEMIDILFVRCLALVEGAVRALARSHSK